MFGNRAKSEGHKVAGLLSTHLKEKEKKFVKLIDQLREESAKGTPIVVEGKKDVEALRSLEVEGPVISIKTGGKSFAEAILEIERTKAKKVILLLDFDRRGLEATMHFKQNLERAKIKPATEFWCGLSGLLGKEIQCIESLVPYLESLRRKIK